MHQVPTDQTLLDRAGTLSAESRLRSLDAIRLASAQLLGADLVAVLTYDQRMATVAGSLASRSTLRPDGCSNQADEPAAAW